MRIARQLAVNAGHEPHRRLVMASAGFQGAPPCLQAHRCAVELSEQFFYLHLVPVSAPYFGVRADHPRRVQTRLTCSHYLAGAGNRILEAAAVEQRSIEVE